MQKSEIWTMKNLNFQTREIANRKTEETNTENWRKEKSKRKVLLISFDEFLYK